MSEGHEAPCQEGITNGIRIPLFIGTGIVAFAPGFRAVGYGMRGTIVIAGQAVETPAMPDGHVFALTLGVHSRQRDVAHGTGLHATATTDTGFRIGTERLVRRHEAGEQRIDHAGLQPRQCAPPGKVATHPCLDLFRYLSDDARSGIQLAVAHLGAIHIETGKEDIRVGHEHRETGIGLQPRPTHRFAPHAVQTACIVATGCQQADVVPTGHITPYVHRRQHARQIFGQSPRMHGEDKEQRLVPVQRHRQPFRPRPHVRAHIHHRLAVQLPGQQSRHIAAISCC